jgi:hypothetical protein
VTIRPTLAGASLAKRRRSPQSEPQLRVVSATWEYEVVGLQFP